MDCEKYLELISAALDGECNAEERRALDSHLAVCPECAELFHTLSANAKAVRELDCDMPADLKDRIMNSLPEQEKPAKQGKVIHWKRWVPVAAAACLVLVISLVPRFGVGGMGMNAAENAAPGAANPASSLLVEAQDYSYGSPKDGNPAETSPAEEPAYSLDPSESYDVGNSTAEFAPVPSADPAEPAHYWFGNQQAIRVHYGATPAPGAQILGSVDSLMNYLSGFDSLTWDGEGNTVPIAELDALAKTYDEEFFQTRRLLCVVIESGSGSNRYELAAQGLYRSSVTILAHIPEVGTCDMAAWLLIAEVDTMFEDGDTLEVIFTY